MSKSPPKAQDAGTGLPAWDGASDGQCPVTHGARHWLVETQDADAQAMAQPNWAMHYEQLSGGPFRGRVHHIQLPRLRLVREDANRALHQQGELGQEAFGLAMQLSTAGSAIFSGQRAAQDDIMVGKGDTLDLVTPPGFALIAVVVDHALLAPLWQHMYQKTPSAWLNQQRVLRARPAAAHAVRQLHLNLMDRLSSPHLPAPSGAELTAWRDSLLMEWIEALPEQVSGHDDSLRLDRRRLVKRASELMLDHAETPLSIPQVCLALGVSRRQLNYCFQEVLGSSPIKYLSALRLGRVRRELRQGVATVAQTAYRWGFWHLGQFARDYRCQFGELPSQTLRRSA
jgi:AraC family ethanolamine operon transcriptional activator